ncbi:MAG: DNA replication/repair protein RecF [Erysipelotrichaceae bacterium]|jgi:DNA replication and repair protein RecF|nr:DNA replication/repair protein RecF [Erysipelotrichaceae bacterium]
MIVEHLELRNFRNYDSAKISFMPGLNVLFGANGQGKTNLLEGLFFLSCARSFRVSEDRQMIQDDKDAAKLSVRVRNDDREQILSGVIYPSQKTLSVNKRPVAKLSEFVGLLNTVLFSPLDMELFHQAPRYCRRFVDQELSKVSRDYLESLRSYNGVLKERNLVLKGEHVDMVYLSVLNTRFVQAMWPVVTGRRKFISELNALLPDHYQKLTGEKHEVQLRYRPGFVWVQNAAELEKQVEKNVQRDLTMHQSVSGAHKDDLEILLDQHPADGYGSQGQKRMLMLALKLSLCSWIEAKSQKKPVLLFDDVFSELDFRHQQQLLNCLPEGVQTLITTTDDSALREYSLPCRRFVIHEGTIEEKNGG